MTKLGQLTIGSVNSCGLKWPCKQKSQQLVVVNIYEQQHRFFIWLRSGGVCTTNAHLVPHRGICCARSCKSPVCMWMQTFCAKTGNGDYLGLDFVALCKPQFISCRPVGSLCGRVCRTAVQLAGICNFPPCLPFSLQLQADQTPVTTFYLK